MLKNKIDKYFVNRLRYNHTSRAVKKRVKHYSRLFKNVGNNIVIKAGVIIKEPENLSLGNNISIQENCFFSCYGGLEIGNDVSFAVGTNIFTTSHKYKQGIIRNNELEILPTVIGNNVWVGAGAKILGGVHIADNVVIAAGAVVNKDCESYCVYGGVPAKVIARFGESRRKDNEG